MSLFPNALTTLARVKARVKLESDTTWDALFEQLINGVSSFIEGEVGRKLRTDTYTQEKYNLDVYQSMLPLRNYPVTAVSAVQYRTGPIGSPSWVDLPTNSWAIDGDGAQGCLNLSTGVSGPNVIRVTYTAGYVMDFTTAANHLPMEISDLCERLVVKAFKKRESEGKDQEGAQESQLTWSKELSPDDKRILLRYTRQAFL